jgi:hypothetical protein
MDFNQQQKETAKLQKRFGDDAMAILEGLAHADAILMKNKGIKFLNALLKEVENDREKTKYDSFDSEEFIYVTSRMDDNEKLEISNLAQRYVEGRKKIVNS